MKTDGLYKQPTYLSNQIILYTVLITIKNNLFIFETLKRQIDDKYCGSDEDEHNVNSMR